ncbi:UDP-N-acetylglucosamine 4,6-dehydratase family protein [Hirschia baltica]|uniref:Polysaccharide biosynthesis protein CapD n=1 Tax=Hirschia baltica (strain ATCC 49814 / DSM 5838 / IFAM 1418) TaxID=582402 RepID=C6XRS0_HIRBI|nr:nucleoside-diphosphate sugar epimerase/dehydratase [Hirschia baltica]ACT60680.1 polysaccharide biosynthesis protein CapD [Hirschia baltica ATCC 49814]
MTRKDIIRAFTIGQRQAWRAIIICTCYDVIAAFVAMISAIYIRNALQGTTPNPVVTALYTVELAVAMVASLTFTGVYRQVWRHTSASDLRRIVQAALLANLIFLPIMFLTNRLEGFFRSSIFIEVPILITIMIAGRLASRARATGQFMAAFRAPNEKKPAAILIGTASKISSTLRDLDNSSEGLPIRPLAIIETSGDHTGRAICGIQVLGDLSKLQESMSIMTTRYGTPPWIAMIGGTLERETMDTVLEVSAKFKATVQRLRADGEFNHDEISPTDLLTRPEKNLDRINVSKLISGARVFVTGAGGTIGSELVRQCASYGPSEITLYDNSEYNLYEIDMYMGKHFPNVQRRALLGDVKEANRLRTAMKKAKPDIVLHAAALKHVPLMETNPNEAILTNVEGARLAATYAAEFGVKNFVFISTDKAVQPSNVMGASKRAAELFIQALAPQAATTNFAIVRFGNVLGSAGSVAPLFERQIKEGGPVTITDAEMTRYFMSVEEASSLVLQASALSSKSPHKEAFLYVLDMGPPVSIVELAERMIRLKGYRPGKDIEIVFTGLRPGEKLAETVFYPKEEVSETGVDGVLSAQSSYQNLDTILPTLDAMIEAARNRERNISLNLLADLAPQLAISKPANLPQNPVDYIRTENVDYLKEKQSNVLPLRAAKRSRSE